jgi:hypothetical protein
VTVAVLDCTASARDLTVQCRPEGAPEGGASENLVVGGQGVYVLLTGTNTAYNSGTGQFTFDVTVKNLIQQPLGTGDGTTLDPAGVRVFFHSGPSVTAGTGTASVIPDGFADFTATGQPYYQYNQILAQNQTSSVRTWTLVMPPSVISVSFKLYVSAAVEYPNGYITLDGLLPDASGGSLHPDSSRTVTAVVRSAVGAPIPGAPVTFGTTDANCAAVSPTGVVTGVLAGTCSVTATSGALVGSLVLNVTGARRTWNGSVSTDWSTGGNWNGGHVPAAVDSAVIPTGVPNLPALSAPVSIGGVQVDDGATLTLGAFDLTASQDVAAGSAGGSGILGGGAGALVLTGTGKTVAGRVPSLRVLGTYTLAGPLFVVAPETIEAGNVTVAQYEMQVVAQ